MMEESADIARLTAALERLVQLLEKHPPSSGGGSASEVILSLVPLTGVVFGCVLLFFFFLWQYRLRRELIRSGQYRPMFMANIRTLTLLIGIMGAASGLPMTILFLSIEGVSYALLGGLLPLCAGIGFLVFYALTIHSERDKERG
jgi:hypothetical protein